MMFLHSVAYLKNNFVTFIITLSPGVNYYIHCFGILNLCVKTPNSFIMLLRNSLPPFQCTSIASSNI